MTSSQRMELEIDLLEKRRQALHSELLYKQRQYEAGMGGDIIFANLSMSEMTRDRDRLDVEIAEKKLELYDIQGGTSLSQYPAEPD